MKFIFTDYFFPLKQKTPFLDHFGLAFDNARTLEEIAEIEGMLKTAIPDGISLMSLFDGMPGGKERYNPDPFTLTSTIAGIFRHLPKDDPYFGEFIDSFTNDQSEPLNVLARMWVLVTIDETKIEEIKKNFDKQLPSTESNSYEWKPSISPELYLEERLYELAHFVGLLTCKYKYWDFSSLLTKSTPLQPDTNLGGIIFGYCIGCYPPEVTTGLKPLSWFHKDIDQLTSIFKEIEKDLSNGGGELILYVANLLYTSINHTLDNKARLLLLVSIIELMLTHNPDFNRFNIEDSISKQFQLKTALIVYQNNKCNDIDTLKKSLHNIYNVRSKIAHGDFMGLKKIVQKHIQQSDYTREIEEHYLFDLNEQLYLYIKAVLEEYFKDRTYVLFMKNN